MYRDDAEARRARQVWLSQLRIATPCPASWEGMTGDDRMRHCALCDRHVYDVSKMTSAEAVELIARTEGHAPCMRLYRRRDGTVITGDCPVGRKKGRRLALVGGAITLALSAVAMAGATESLRKPIDIRKLASDGAQFDGDAFLSDPRPSDPPNAPSLVDTGVILLGAPRPRVAGSD